ncbi:hypothetical protein, no similarity [Maudiozyma saulgeensis]|uniref:PA14 domain-containing protein n=1 Tax=Maudiozyma saulgeensis TaxID=1789683 RepID=A0A1X7RBL9_9SACH|nr:hypothetical protein, no similarity [Kazachstania saulgeensis]
MQLTAVLSVFLFMVNAITMVSADECAAYTPTTYSDSSFLMAIHKAALNSALTGVSGTLHNYAAKILSPDSATTALTTYDISLNISIADSTSVSAPLYPELADETTVSNFVSIYKAFLVPPTTGDYIFSIDEVSDAASIYIFDDRAMYCCNDMNLADWFSETSNFCYVPEDSDYQTNSMTVHLEGGLGYVIVFAYTNHGGDAIFKPSMTLPSGEVITNFEGYIHGSVEDAECGVRSAETTSYTQGSAQYNTTYSTAVVTYETINDYARETYTDVETIVYIMTPAAYSSSVVSSSTSEVVTSSTAESSSITSSAAVTSATATSAAASSAVETSAVQSSAVSSAEESSAQSSESAAVTQSSATTSGNLDANSAVRKTTSSVISSSETEVSSSYSSNTLVSSSIDTKSSSNSSSAAVSTQGTNSNSKTASVSSTSAHSTAVAGEDSEQRDSSNDDSMSTSTYTDVYGITRTTTVKCATESNGSNSKAANQPETKSQGITQTIVTVTTCTAKNGDVSVSTITVTEVVAATKATKETGANAGVQNNNQAASTTSRNNFVSSVTVQMQSSAATSSASVSVQDAPNAAGKIATGFFFSFIPLLFI